MIFVAQLAAAQEPGEEPGDQRVPIDLDALLGSEPAEKPDAPSSDDDASVEEPWQRVRSGNQGVNVAFGRFDNTLVASWAFAVRGIVGLRTDHRFVLDVGWSPDLGEADVTGLTTALVQIAHTGPGGANFQQPVSHPRFSAAAVWEWAPLAGSASIADEIVGDLEFVTRIGLGMYGKLDYFAVYDDTRPDQVSLSRVGNELKVSLSPGAAVRFFPHRSWGVDLSGTLLFYVDNIAQYDEDVPVQGQRLYAPFIVQAGVTFVVGR